MYENTLALIDARIAYYQECVQNVDVSYGPILEELKFIKYLLTGEVK